MHPFSTDKFYKVAPIFGSEPMTGGGKDGTQPYTHKGHVIGSDSKTGTPSSEPFLKHHQVVIGPKLTKPAPLMKPTSVDNLPGPSKIKLGGKNTKPSVRSHGSHY